jgi:hypothetical protein
LDKVRKDFLMKAGEKDARFRILDLGLAIDR